MIARHAARRLLVVATLPVLLAVVALDAGAQGKGKDKGPSNGGGNGGEAAKPAKPAKVRKHSHAEVVDISRQVIVSKGYVVSKVENVGDTRVIYYYRGNNGRGKGRGPLLRLVVRPTPTQWVVESPTKDVSTGGVSTQDLMREVQRRVGF